MQKNGLILRCKNCGKKVYIPKSRIKEFRYCSLKCHYEHRIKFPIDQTKVKRNYGKNHPNWKGGYIDKRGYKHINVNGERVYEHRYVMEKHLGRKLTFNETIHHIDGNKSNNKRKNLELLSRSDHTRQNPLKHKVSLSKFKVCIGCNNNFYRKDSKTLPQFRNKKYCCHKCYLSNRANNKV